MTGGANSNRSARLETGGHDLQEQITKWPTPNTGNAKRGEREPDGKRGEELIEAVRKWPAPQAHDAKVGKSPARVEAMRERTGAGVMNLNEYAEVWPLPTQWPAPAARDYKGENSEAHLSVSSGALHLDQLPNFVAHRWPSATVKDADSAARHTTTATAMHPGTTLIDAVRSHSSLPGPTTLIDGPLFSESTPTSHPASGKNPDADGAAVKVHLNPVFDEWLMGLPLGWTDYAPAATAWSHWLQRSLCAFWLLASACGLPVDRSIWVSDDNQD